MESRSTSLLERGEGESIEISSLSSSTETIATQEALAQQSTVSAQPSSHPLTRIQDENSTGPEIRNHWSLKLERYKQNGFIYLAVLAGVMITINITQATLIDHFSSYGWIVGFPAAVFGSGITAIMVWVVGNRHILATTWHEASLSKRSAWLGVILSLVLPIIVCDFIYLPLWALPAYQSVKWSTSIDMELSQIPPAILLVTTNPFITFFSHKGKPSASLRYGSGRYSKAVVSSIEHFQAAFSGGHEMPLQWLSFTPNMSDPGVEVSDSAEFWQLDVNITYNSSHPLGPEYENNSDSYVPSIKAILYDSALPVNYSDMFNTQGSPLGRLLRHAITIPAVTATPKWPAYVDTFRTIDGAGDLKLKYAQNYKFYHGQRPWLTWDNQLGTKCDVGRNGTAPCQLSLPFTFSSPMVTVERSSRGTDTLTILIDEGSILGAILFFTWFFGIFIT